MALSQILALICLFQNGWCQYAIFIEGARLKKLAASTANGNALKILGADLGHESHQETVKNLFLTAKKKAQLYSPAGFAAAFKKAIKEKKAEKAENRVPSLDIAIRIKATNSGDEKSVKAKKAGTSLDSIKTAKGGESIEQVLQRQYFHAPPLLFLCVIFFFKVKTALFW